MRVDIGAGRHRRDGWTTLDADQAVDPDIVATVPPLPESCRGADVFRMIHVFEHFFLWEARALLAECHDKLAPAGRLVIECPNLDSAIAALSGASGRPKRQWGYWVLYGDPGHKNPLYGHRWGWTPETLTAELKSAGFLAENIKPERPRYHVPERDMRIVAVKQ